MTENKDSIPGSGKRKYEIGLCLSGGGFRAALFHLGALRRLNELGILKNLDTISSVSGGSILSAFLADRIVKGGKTSLDFSDWDKEVSKPFREFVSKDLRTVPFLAHLLWNWLVPRFRVKCLENRYKKRLTGLRLEQLPVSPRFILCATDITFGINWVFSRNEVGDYQAGYIKTALSWPLARAVAASSSFPPIFGPMRPLAKAQDFSGGNYREEDRGKLLSRLELSDGGVYDNMGLEPVFKDHQCILVSNCGAPFDFKISKNYIRRLLRYTRVITNQAVALRTRFFHTGITKKWHDGAFWSINSSAGEEKKPGVQFEGYSKELVDKVLSNVRTDLDAFTEAEMSVLENHGYFAADAGIGKYLVSSRWLGSPIPPLITPYEDWTDEEKVKKAMKSSHQHISLSRILRCRR